MVREVGPKWCSVSTFSDSRYSRDRRARQPSFRREANFAVLSNLAACFLILFTYLMAAVGCRILQMSLSFAEMSCILNPQK